MTNMKIMGLIAAALTLGTLACVPAQNGPETEISSELPPPTGSSQAETQASATATQSPQPPTPTPPQRAENPGEWQLHTISDLYGGPDGIKLRDINGDGWLDISTAYEWSGDLMLFIHPGPEAAEEAWPSVRVGNVDSGEDALPIDLNGDGNVDVISAHEGNELVLSVHMAPANAANYLDAERWEEDFIRVSRNHSWLFLYEMDVDQDGEIEIVAGSKDDRDLGREAVGELAWLDPPDETSGWEYHVIGRLSWPMSIIAYDLDQDGDEDLLVSDRRGSEAHKGMRWFENPGKEWENTWMDHFLADIQGVDPFFVDIGDVDNDGSPELVVPIEDPLAIKIIRLDEALSEDNVGSAINLAYDFDFGAGHFKSVAVGDVDLDGQAEIVVTLVDSAFGLGYFDNPTGALEEEWQWVSLLDGLERPKFDLVELYDMDGDGDLDIVTTEDQIALGVMWLENPYAAEGD